MKAVTAYSATGTALSVTSGRLAYSYRLKGPALSIDTACSSSLVGLHMACTAIRCRHASLAFNCGINLMLVPETPAMFQRAGMMTPDGRCKTLDAAADGYVRAESVVVSLLQSASGSMAHSDDSASVFIHGTAVNQGGRSSTLTAPNGPSQQDVIRNALSAGTSAPRQVAALQLHGTGTPLGDPIEVGAAGTLFVESSVSARAQKPFVLMASKSWVGHSEPAAGMAGFVHASTRISYGTVPGISHLQALNPYVITSIKVPGKFLDYVVAYVV